MFALFKAVEQIVPNKAEQFKLAAPLLSTTVVKKRENALVSYAVETVNNRSGALTPSSLVRVCVLPEILWETSIKCKELWKI